MVVVPESYKGLPITEIGRAFEDNEKLTKVTIPNSVKIIGNNAFSGSSNLQEVNFPNWLTEIRSRAFKESGIKKLIFQAQ